MSALPARLERPRCPHCLKPIDRAALGKPEQIIRLVAADAGVSVPALVGTTKGFKYVWPRQVAWWLITEATGRSTVQLGRDFARDHTTISHGLRVVEARRAKDADERERIDRLLAEIVNGTGPPRA